MCCVILTLTYFRVEPPESIWTPCNLLVLILILSECKQAELSADFLSDFANFMSVLYFSACARPSGILYYIFLLVERDLVFCVIYFPDFLFILCCIIPTLISLSLFFFSACLKLSLIYALFTCGILCYIFLRLKRAWYFETFGYIFYACVVFVMYTCYYKRQKTLWKTRKYLLYFSVGGTISDILCYMIPHVERTLVYCVICFHVWNVLWYFVLYISACGMCSGIFCYIFYMWNALWYFFFYFYACGMRSGIVCYILLHVERALFFVLYFSTCGIRSGIVDLRVIFFHVWNALWYFVLYIFLLFSSFCVELYLPWFPLKVSFLPVWN